MSKTRPHSTQDLFWLSSSRVHVQSFQSPCTCTARWVLPADFIPFDSTNKYKYLQNDFLDKASYSSKGSKVMISKSWRFFARFWWNSPCSARWLKTLHAHARRTELERIFGRMRPCFTHQARSFGTKFGQIRDTFASEQPWTEGPRLFSIFPSISRWRITIFSSLKTLKVAPFDSFIWADQCLRGPHSEKIQATTRKVFNRLARACSGHCATSFTCGLHSIW